MTSNRYKCQPICVFICLCTNLFASIPVSLLVHLSMSLLSMCMSVSVCLWTSNIYLCNQLLPGRLSVWMSNCICVYQSVSLYVCLPVCPPVRKCICMSVYPFLHLSISVSACPSIISYLFACVFYQVCVLLFVCLYVTLRLCLHLS
jgi:hypothetical protein